MVRLTVKTLRVQSKYDLFIKEGNKMTLEESIAIKNKGSKSAKPVGQANPSPGKTLPGISKTNSYF